MWNGKKLTRKRLAPGSPHPPGRHGIEISMDARGAPTAYRIKRWSNANPAGTFQYQPFGGTPEQFIDVDGIRVAQKVNVGNHFGTPDYFPFFLKRSLQKSNSFEIYLR